jgi:drug/metabolite transporter (DMT)-like permease
VTDASEPLPAIPQPRPVASAKVGAGAYALLLLGVFACSLSVIFIKKSEAHPIWLAGIRLLIAAACLSPLVVLELRKDRSAISSRSLLGSLPGAVLLAAHFISWAAGARMTSSANGNLLVNLTPVVMPIVMWLMNGERVNWREILGTLIALTGVVALVGSHAKFGGESVPGDLMCFLSMALFCCYLGFSRRNASGKSLWPYLVPLYWMSGLICVATALIARAPFPVMTRLEVAMLLCLGLVPTVLGHSIINNCIRIMRGQTVSIVNLSQFVFAGIIGYVIFNEKPSIAFYPVCALIVIGAVIVIRAHRTSVDVDAES